MKKNIALLIVLAALIFSGCKSFTREGGLLSDANRARSRGDYHMAVMNVVESVRIDNEYEDALSFLAKTYAEANSFYLQKINEKKSSSSKFANDDIVEYYEYLKAINDAVSGLPMLYDPKTGAPLNFEYTDYQPSVEEHRELAAEDHYNEGLKLMTMKGRENAKQASREFETALSFVPGFKDAERRAQKSLENATQVVAFFPFKNNAWSIPTEKFSDLIQNQAISNLLSDSEVMKYTKIIDRQMQESLMAEQVESLTALMDDKSRVEIGNLLNANIFLTGSIESTETTGPSTTMNQYHRQRTIEHVKEIPGETYKVESDGVVYTEQAPSTTEITYQEVWADVYHYTKFIKFSVTITFKAVDVETGAILLSDTIVMEEYDRSEWAEWAGDERALTWEDKDLVNSYEKAIMTPQQIATSAAQSLGNDLAAKLTSILK